MYPFFINEKNLIKHKMGKKKKSQKNHKKIKPQHLKIIKDKSFHYPSETLYRWSILQSTSYPPCEWSKKKENDES